MIFLRQKLFLLTCLVIVAGVLLFVVVRKEIFHNFGSLKTAVIPPSTSMSSSDEKLPLHLPNGFRISVFADKVDQPRVMKQDPLGQLIVSSPSQGTVTLLADENRDGKVDTRTQLLHDLQKPHGLALSCQPEEPCTLFVAETQAVSSYSYDPKTKQARLLNSITSLPEGGNHFSRTIEIGPDNRLYVSIGSSCDVCVEKDQRRASILSLNQDGSDIKPVGMGLRNSVFFTWRPQTDELWATEMGRDFLGDNLPPDEINVIKQGGHYGWPYCYGKQIHDEIFDPKGEKRNFCQKETVPSAIDIPAHSAPLGLAFVPQDSNWPIEYRGNLLVSYHGSWNRSSPTGYTVVRYVFDKNMNLIYTEDFISGWLTTDGSALGRPVDLLFDSAGALYISDDKANLIYKVIPSDIDSNE